MGNLFGNNAFDWSEELKMRDEADLADELRKRMVRVGPGLSIVSVEDDPKPEDGTPAGLQAAAATQHPQSDIVLREWTDSYDQTTSRVESYRSPMTLAAILVASLAVQCGYFALTAALAHQGAAAALVSITRLHTLQSGLFWFTAVGFAIWVYRLSANLPGLGVLRQPRHPVVAAAAVITPVVNLIMPFQVLGDIWRASDPRQTPDEPAPVRSFDDIGIVLWWSTVVLAAMISGFGIVAAIVNGQQQLTPPAVLSDSLNCISALLGISVVWRLSARQEDKRFVTAQLLAEE